MNLLIGLRPELMTLCVKHKEISRHEGIEWIIAQGYRTFEEQLELYGHGRKRTPGGWVVVDTKAIVTRALPDDSAHCRRAAYDVAILRDGKLVWDGIDDLYAKVGALGEELGLVWGGTFAGLPDMDHFELKNWKELPIV